MCYGSETHITRALRAREAGWVWNDVIAAILKVWRQIENTTPQSMRIYLKNNPAKFHPDPIWNDGALGFWRRSLQQQEEEQEVQEQDE